MLGDDLDDFHGVGLHSFAFPTLLEHVHLHRARHESREATAPQEGNLLFGGLGEADLQSASAH